MKNSPPHFDTTQDMRAYIKRRVNRLELLWTLPTVCVLLLVYWAGANGLGAPIQWAGALAEKALGEIVGRLVLLAGSMSLYVVLPLAPVTVVVSRYKRTLKRRMRERRCIVCGYDVKAAATEFAGDTLACSECGATYAMKLRASGPPAAS